MQRSLRPVAIFSLTAYLLAVTCGVALHSAVHVHIGHVHAHCGIDCSHHAPRDEKRDTRPDGHAPGCSHHHHGHDHHDHGEQLAPEHAPVPCHHHNHDHDHECVVCDFLAQMPAPVAPVELPPDLELIEPLSLLAATTPAPRPFSAWQGRAPPV